MFRGRNGNVNVQEVGIRKYGKEEVWHHQETSVVLFFLSYSNKTDLWVQRLVPSKTLEMKLLLSKM